jgi:hypothetical protein
MSASGRTFHPQSSPGNGGPGALRRASTVVGPAPPVETPCPAT